LLHEAIFTTELWGAGIQMKLLNGYENSINSWYFRLRPCVFKL